MFPPTVTRARICQASMHRQLHWLSIRQRSVFKLATVTYKARLSGLPAYLQCVELCAQLQLFSFSNNQPLYHLQRERFVQPLLQSGTLLVSTPVQLIRLWHLRTGLKLNCLNLATCTCFDAIAACQIRLWIIGHIRNLFLLYCIRICCWQHMYIQNTISVIWSQQSEPVWFGLLGDI